MRAITCLSIRGVIQNNTISFTKTYFIFDIPSVLSQVLTIFQAAKQKEIEILSSNLSNSAIEANGVDHSLTYS